MPVFSPLETPCRFIALVKLEQKLANNPNKKLLMEAIAKKRLGQFDSFFDHLHTEMIITGDQSALLQSKIDLNTRLSQY